MRLPRRKRARFAVEHCVIEAHDGYLLVYPKEGCYSLESSVRFCDLVLKGLDGGVAIAVGRERPTAGILRLAELAP